MHLLLIFLTSDTGTSITQSNVSKPPSPTSWLVQHMNQLHKRHSSCENIPGARLTHKLGYRFLKHALVVGFSRYLRFGHLHGLRVSAWSRSQARRCSHESFVKDTTIMQYISETYPQHGRHVVPLHGGVCRQQRLDAIVIHGLDGVFLRIEKWVLSKYHRVSTSTVNICCSIRINRLLLEN